MSTVSTQRVADGLVQGVGLWQSNVIETESLSAFSVFAVFSGTFVGDFYIEATNVRGAASVDNWWLITPSYQALTGSTELLLDASVFAYSLVRICSTITSGSATITVDVSRKIR